MSNNKKQLLNESTVRRFMGLAGIGALSNNFVDEKGLNEQEIPAVTPEEWKKTVGFDNPPQEPKEYDPEDVRPAAPREIPGPAPEKELDEQEDLGALPLPDEAGLEGEAGLECEAGLEGEEEPVQDIDLTPEEASVLIDLGQKLAGEMPEEEPGMEVSPEEMGAPGMEVPPEEMGPPPEGMPMQEALIHKLTARVANRIKKEYVVNEVMKRVAKRLRKNK